MTQDHTETASGILFASETAPPRPTLIVAHHPDPARAGYARVFRPDESVLIGRDAEGFPAGLLDDRRMSRRHAAIVCMGNGLSIRDLESRNGTVVNGERVTEARLVSGDIVAMGSLLFVVQSAPPLPAPARSPAPIAVGHAMQAVMHQISLVADRDTTVLLQGDTGVGKEVVARYLHHMSGRSGAFVPVNCASLTDSLVESALFGHVRGAFTGAGARRSGLVETAEGGTLFLDEVGDANPAVQVALLRLLQDREVRPVGSDRVTTVDVRFVAATHQDLDAKVSAGQLRADLKARLDQWTVRIPPLCDRREDILPLARHFAAEQSGASPALSTRLAHALLRAHWSGNVRELQAFIERVVVSGGNGELLEGTPELLGSISSTNQTIQEPAPRRRRRHTGPPPSPDELKRALTEAGGNVKTVSEALGVGRNTLYRWMKAAGIDLDAVRGAVSEDTDTGG
jgi:DNA-binding NtrC family response regulator